MALNSELKQKNTVLTIVVVSSLFSGQNGNV